MATKQNLNDEALDKKVSTKASTKTSAGKTASAKVDTEKKSSTTKTSTTKTSTTKTAATKTTATRNATGTKTGTAKSTSVKKETDVKPISRKSASSKIDILKSEDGLLKKAEGSVKSSTGKLSSVSKSTSLKTSSSKNSSLNDVKTFGNDFNSLKNDKNLFSEEKKHSSLGENLFSSDFNSSINKKNEKESFNLKKYFTKKNIIILSLCLLIGILILILIFGVKSCRTNQSNKHINLVNTYIDKGLYQNALDKLEDLYLRKMISNDEFLELLDKISEHTNDKSVNFDSSKFEESLDNLSNVLAKQQLEYQKNNEANAQAIKDLVNSQKTNEITKVSETILKQQEAEKKANEEKIKQKKEAEKKDKEAQIRKQKEDALKSEIEKYIADGKSKLGYGSVSEAMENFEKAKSKLKELGDFSPDSKSYISNSMGEIAEALQKSSDTLSEEQKNQAKDAALSYAKETLQKDESNPQSHYILGMNYLERGNDARSSGDINSAKNYYLKAESELKKAVEKPPLTEEDKIDYAMYYYQLGRTQFYQNKFENSISSFSQSIKYNGNYAPAYYNLGVAFERTSKSKESLSKALSAYRNAYRVDPSHENSYAAAGRILLKFEDYRGAIDAFSSAVKIKPEKIAFYEELGVAYEKNGNYDEAENCFIKALAGGTSSRPEKTYYNLANVLNKQNRNEEALEYIEKAYKIASNDEDILFLYAVIEKEIDVMKSIELYNTLLKKNPKHVNGSINLGVLFLEQGKEYIDSAIGFLKNALAIEPNNFRANNNLGNAYRDKEDYNNAIVYYKKALDAKVSGSDVSEKNKVKENLAKAYASSGQFTFAKSLYEDIVKLNSKNYEAMFNLIKVCVSLEDYVSAEKWINNLQNTNPNYRKIEVDEYFNLVKSNK